MISAGPSSSKILSARALRFHVGGMWGQVVFSFDAPQPLSFKGNQEIEYIWSSMHMKIRLQLVPRNDF